MSLSDLPLLYDIIGGWVVGNNSGDDDTGDEDAFGNFDADDTTDDKVIGDNDTNDANEDEGVGVNVVAFDTVEDEYFVVNATSAVSKDNAGVAKTLLLPLLM